MSGQTQRRNWCHREKGWQAESFRGLSSLSPDLKDPLDQAREVRVAELSEA